MRNPTSNQQSASPPLSGIRWGNRPKILGAALCTADWLSAKLSRKNEQPPKAGDAKFRFEWDPLNDQR